MKKITLQSVIIFFVFSLLSLDAMSNINSEVEDYISETMKLYTPHKVEILNTQFIVKDNKVYKPDKLTEMFFQYLQKNHLISNKIIADVGAGCFPLGILAAKNGASKVIGLEITNEAIKCSRENINLNNVTKNSIILRSNGTEALSNQYNEKFDLILGGIPWNTISSADFSGIPVSRQSLSRAFYDVDDKLILDLLQHSSRLLANNGRVFITSSSRNFPRIKNLCFQNNIDYKIVKEDDLYYDGNIHYIIELLIK